MLSKAKHANLLPGCDSARKKQAPPQIGTEYQTAVPPELCRSTSLKAIALSPVTQDCALLSQSGSKGANTTAFGNSHLPLPL